MSCNSWRSLIKKSKWGKLKKTNQIGKSHHYPTQKKSYSSSRAGIGGRKKKEKNKPKPSGLSYFDKLIQAQTTQGMDLVFPYLKAFSL